MCAGQDHEVSLDESWRLEIDGSGRTWHFLKVYQPWKKGDFSYGRSTTLPVDSFSATVVCGVLAVGFKSPISRRGQWSRPTN
jgi:hypothetical protein